jgi:hypothetical protein
VLLQEYAMQYYGVFFMALMIFVVSRIYYQKDVFWIGIIGGLGGLALANLFASVKMHRKIAEILFVNDTFSVISAYDIAFQSELTNFPLRLANPTRTAEVIQIHYTDVIMELKKEDWGEEFEVIWEWLNQTPPSSPGGGIGITYSIVRD